MSWPDWLALIAGFFTGGSFALFLMLTAELIRRFRNHG